MFRGISELSFHLAHPTSCTYSPALGKTNTRRFVPAKQRISLAHTTLVSFTSGFSCSVIFFSSFCANATNFVWLPLATISPFLLMNRTDVYASVLPTETVLVSQVPSHTQNNIHLSHTTSPRIVSPILPPTPRYVTLRSVETPVENKPREATASEPLVSTMLAIVPPCSIPRRLVCCFWMSSSKFTFPGEAAVTRS